MGEFGNLTPSLLGVLGLVYLLADTIYMAWIFDLRRLDESS